MPRTQAQRLLSITEVADRFDLSVQQMRAYENFGIIDPIDRIGNKKLYSPKEVALAITILRKHRTKTTLKQIGKIVESEVEKVRNDSN